MGSIVSILSSNERGFLFRRVRLRSGVERGNVTVSLGQERIIHSGEGVRLACARFRVLRLLTRGPKEMFDGRRVCSMI